MTVKETCTKIINAIEYEEAINILSDIVVRHNTQNIKDFFADDEMSDSEKAGFGTTPETIKDILNNLNIIDDIAKKVGEKQEIKKRLYTWAWIGGGYNQTYAYHEETAIEEANSYTGLEPNMSSFKLERNPEAYWDNLPLMD